MPRGLHRRAWPPPTARPPTSSCGCTALVDVLIPARRRGPHPPLRGARSKVPVIETGTGNCHVYLHASADPERWPAPSSVNAKCRRYGVCNAAETLLVDAAAADAVPACPCSPT